MPFGVADEPVGVMKPGNAGGAKGPWDKESAASGRFRGVGSYLTWLFRTEQANDTAEDAYENPAEFWHRTGTR